MLCPPVHPIRLKLHTVAALIIALVLTSCGDAREDLITAPSSPSAAAQAQDFRAAIRAAERHTPGLMSNPVIVGTGVGLNEAGRPSVRLYLAHGQARGIPDHLDGVPVSTVVTGLFVLRDDRTARARPAPVGFSIGHPNVTAGTLGARVTDGTSVFILSNNHILANNNNASIGDPILQPGAHDGGSQPGDVIGTLHAFEPISFSSNNTMDAAIAIVNGNDVRGSTPDGVSYGAPSGNITVASVGMPVQKYGRTTGHTTGMVAETNVTVSVCFVTRGPFMCAQAATFVGQISISDGSFSSGGDSGSLIVTSDENNDAVGLLFAGSATRTIANPIGPVLQRFGVTIDPTIPGGSGPPPPGETDPPSPETGTVHVSAVTYSAHGGPQQNRHLSVTIGMINHDGDPVAGASVSATLLNTTTNSSWNGSGTTGSGGTFSFQLNNAPAGRYETTVNSVNAGGLEWDENSPDNFWIK